MVKHVFYILILPVEPEPNEIALNLNKFYSFSSTLIQSIAIVQFFHQSMPKPIFRYYNSYL